MCSRDLLAERVSALATSKVVWEAQQDFSREAKTAVKAITVVLTKAARVEESYSRSSLHWEKNVFSAAGVNEPMPGSSTANSAPEAVFEQRIAEHDAFLGTPVSYDDEIWSSIFDVDQSWDTWIQR